MKSVSERRLKLLSYLYRSLLFCLIILGLVVIGGTIYGFFFRSIPTNNVQIDSFQKDGEKDGEGQTFTGIGLLRVSTTDPQPGMVILFVSFIYYPRDKAFSEELVLRIRDFREIIENYIGSFTVIELQAQGEEVIKTELLRRFNTVLRLGQIEMLYFSDFMIIG